MKNGIIFIFIDTIFKFITLQKSLQRLPYKQAKREVIFEPAYLKEPIPKENPTLLCPLQYKMQYYVPVQSCVPMQNCEPIQNYAPIQNYEPMQSCIPMPSCVPMPSYEPMQNYVQTKICFPL